MLAHLKHALFVVFQMDFLCDKWNNAIYFSYIGYQKMKSVCLSNFLAQIITHCDIGEGSTFAQ
jgi:hypothetical protein